MKLLSANSSNLEESKNCCLENSCSKGESCLLQGKKDCKNKISVGKTGMPPYCHIVGGGGCVCVSL